MIPRPTNPTAAGDDDDMLTTIFSALYLCCEVFLVERINSVGEKRRLPYQDVVQRSHWGVDGTIRHEPSTSRRDERINGNETAYKGE